MCISLPLHPAGAAIIDPMGPHMENYPVEGVSREEK
jgi:hypothetical protein